MAWFADTLICHVALLTKLRYSKARQPLLCYDKLYICLSAYVWSVVQQFVIYNSE